MSEFNETRWTDSEFSREYRDNADIYIVERRRMFEIMKSFYRNFLMEKRNNSVLDLGCGDGILTRELMNIDETLSATLIDASSDMLAAAKKRLNGLGNIRYIKASFQEMLSGEYPGAMFDFAVSAQAIHHLSGDEKKLLFKYIYTSLQPGGHFLNIDVVTGETGVLEKWYMKLWQEWMEIKITSLGRGDISFQDIVRRYKCADENRPDTLDSQLKALKEIGFQDVDCFYKYGIFAVYGGRKEKP